MARSRQASAITGRKRQVASPFMPRYKPTERPPSPEALTEELAPSPVKKKVMSPGTAADMGPGTGPSATGVGAKVGMGVAKGLMGSVGSVGGGLVGGAIAGPPGALVGSLIGGYYASKLPKLEEMGSGTYAGEIGDWAHRGLEGRIDPMSGQLEGVGGRETEQGWQGRGFEGRMDPSSGELEGVGGN